MAEPANTTELTREQILEVPCIQCDAFAGQPCVVGTPHSGKQPMVGFHRLRIDLRTKQPALPADLNATDKSLITYYAYVLICDSVSAKSVEMFGKHFSSTQIQAKFAREAVKQLKADGLLK